MSVHDYTVYDMIARGASVFGDAPALIEGGRSLSFRELRRRVDGLAGGLAGLDLGKGDRLCILAHNTSAYVELYGACARLGIIAYPINWRLTAREVALVVERAGPRMMVVDTSTRGVVGAGSEWTRSILHWYEFGEVAGPGFAPLAALYRDGADALPVGVGAEDPFAVISTAAVDVVPRGAVLSHANLVAATLTAIAGFGTSSADRYLLALPLFHITALGGALAHLHAGGACVVVSRFDPEEAVRLIDRHAITHLSDFPPVLSSLLDAAERLGSRLPSLTHVSGLDAPQTIERLHAQTRARFWTGFGQSETSGLVSLQRVLDRPGAAGKPVPGCRLVLMDDDGHEVPMGAAGEIAVRGPLVFQGYFGQPDVTAYTFRNGWHHTGDLGRLDADGYLHYVGRKPEKELIKPGGENVYPAEVESVIIQMDGVRGVCVYGIPDAKWGEAIKAVVELEGTRRYTAAEVSDFVASRIARFKKPHAVAFTDALPRTPTGAVDREAVKTAWGPSP